MTVGTTTATARAGAKATKKRTGWTKAKQRQFLELVAMTGNARLAARAVGLSDRGARTLRRRDPAFDAAWRAAVEDGYGQMEEELLARALGQGGGGEGGREGGGDGAAVVVGFDPVLALKLLQMRGAGARGAGGRGGGAKATPLATATSQEALDAMLLERLDALARRLASRG